MTQTELTVHSFSLIFRTCSHNISKDCKELCMPGSQNVTCTHIIQKVWLISGPDLKSRQVWCSPLPANREERRDMEEVSEMVKK